VKNIDAIPYYSLEKIHQDLQEGMKNTFLSVMEGNWFVLGRHLEEFEDAFADFTGVKFAIGVGNGLDGLKISLRCLDLQKGDKMVIPAHTFSASVLAAVENGITPVLADVNRQDGLLDAGQFADKLKADVKVVMPVHLYGNPCDMQKIAQVAEAAGIYIVEDFAQSVGAMFRGQPTGSFGTVNATSFYPVKPLGALGDGGMITTNDPDLNQRCRKLRNYGYSGKSTMELTGYNSRLDELQAAFLMLKMKHLERWKMDRVDIAHRYLQNLSDLEQVILPPADKNNSPAFHIFPIRLRKRDDLKIYLEENRIQTQIHYPVPPHLQPAFRFLGYRKGDFPVTEEISDTELSLPIYPGLSTDSVDRISQCIRHFIREKK
jgi:dTDP-4-amino-4,6-dideoxygalactose transaminase